MSENKEKDRERETSTEKKTSETVHRIQMAAKLLTLGTHLRIDISL